MVGYGDIPVNLLDDVNEAFVHFSFEQDDSYSAEEMVSDLIAYGLVYLGYLKFVDGEFVYDCEV